MSNYRDDTQETAVASSSTWLGLTTITEEVARATATALFTLLVIHADVVAASDEVIDRWSHLTTEVATASDEVFDQVRSVQLVTDSVAVSDTVMGTLVVLHEDAATVSDEVIERLIATTAETIQVADEVVGIRHSVSLVEEFAKVTDLSIQAASVLVEESAGVSDAVDHIAKAGNMVEELLTASDEVVDSHQSAPALAFATALASDEVFDRLHAGGLVVESAVAEDEVIQFGLDHGQAWTANADTWAMSRYEPFTFDSVAVIDGVLYGTNEQGVFALDDQSAQIQASLKTGKVDVGGKVLAHPVSAYLEYELDGTAEMDVTTTQSGAAQTYTYGLPAELAEELTNGRFVFGRGLRGRHFSFTLRMTGTHGHINDLSVTTVPTKRRV